MGGKVAKSDVNKRSYSNYYGELSVLWFGKSKEEIDLWDVQSLSNPPTNLRIHNMVKAGLLSNVLY